MIMPGVAYETSSGGPFMRDINSQSGDDQELYWYMNSGHVRTEPWRFGLMGPYAMRFTSVRPQKLVSLRLLRSKQNWGKAGTRP
jgi:hypothetical protein